MSRLPLQDNFKTLFSILFSIINLLQVKELAVDAVNPHLYTIATLTGHAVLTVGTNYTIGKFDNIIFSLVR